MMQRNYPPSPGVRDAMRDQNDMIEGKELEYFHRISGTMKRSNYGFDGEALKKGLKKFTFKQKVRAAQILRYYASNIDYMTHCEHKDAESSPDSTYERAMKVCPRCDRVQIGWRKDDCMGFGDPYEWGKWGGANGKPY